MKHNVNTIKKSRTYKYFAHSLASTVLTIIPSICQAGLVPVLLTSNSGILPDLGQGYLLANPLGSITFTIVDGDTVGNSFINLLGLNQSVDALLPAPGLADTLAFAGDATLTAGIGGTHTLGKIELLAAGAVVSFQNTVNSVTMNFEADAIANFSDAGVMNGNVDNTSGVNNTGTLQFQGGGQVTGDIGTTSSLLLLNIDSAGNANETLELNGATINVANIHLSDDSSGTPANATSLRLNNAVMDLSGDITVNTHNQNILDITNAATITGNIGTVGKALHLINVGLHNDLLIDGNLYSTTTLFQGDNTLTLTDDKAITGAVDTIVAGTGSILFQGGGIITGNIGNTNNLSLITANSSAAANNVLELNGLAINTNTLNIKGGAGNATTILLNSPGLMDFTGNITTNNNNLDILNIANLSTTTINGTIGGTGKAFSLVMIGQNSDVTLNGNLTASTTQFQNDHILSLTDGRLITGTIDSNAPGIGTLQFQGGGRITGNIGNTNALSSLTLNSTGASNKIIELDGAIINANNTIVVGNGNNPTTLLLNGPIGMTFEGDITTNNNNINIINVMNTGATTFNGNIGGVGHAFNLIKVGQNNTTTMNGDIFASITQFQANNILNIGNNATINGSVDTKTAGTGILQFLGNSTITGNAGTNALAAVNLLGAGAVINFQGDITANAFNYLNDATAIINDTKSVSAPVTTTLNNQGSLQYLGSTTIDLPIGTQTEALKAIAMTGSAGKTINLNNNIYATDTNVNNGATLVVNNNHTIGGNLTLSNGSILGLSSNSAQLSVGGNFTLDNNTILSLDMANALATGLVDVAGIGSVNAGSVVSILNPPGNIPGGQATLTIVEDGSGAGANLHVIPVNSNSLLYNFRTQVTGNLLQLVISNIATSSLALNCHGTDVSHAIDVLIGANLSGSLESIINQLGSFTNEAEICQALTTISPIANAAVSYESFQAQDESFNILDERKSKLHFCKKYPNHPICKIKGFSAGDEISVDGAWLKVLGLVSQQDERHGIEGYKNNMIGLAFGSDLYNDENCLLGLAFNWSNLDISQQIAGAKTRANSYQEMIYGNYNFSNGAYVNWGAALAYNTYEIDRNILFGKILLSPKGQFHGWQPGAKAEIGYEIESFAAHTIPIASLYYSHLALSEYTEQGIDTANQHINDLHYDTLIAGVGVKFEFDYLYRSMLLQPEIHIMSFYDLIGDNVEVTSQFVGGGPSFTTIGAQATRTAVNLGTSVSVLTSIGLVMTAKLDMNFKENYYACNGFFKLRHEW